LSRLERVKLIFSEKKQQPLFLKKLYSAHMTVNQSQWGCGGKGLVLNQL